MHIFLFVSPKINRLQMSYKSNVRKISSEVLFILVIGICFNLFIYKHMSNKSDEIRKQCLFKENFEEYFLRTLSSKTCESRLLDVFYKIDNPTRYRIKRKAVLTSLSTCSPCPRGPPGLPGPVGPKGSKGDSGTNGINGKPGGPSGPIGLTGTKGEPGENALDGKPGPPGQNGEKGTKGEPGENALNGKAGPPGQNGEKGTKGEPGENALNGKAGPPGQNGEKGTKGEPGENAMNGKPGPPGQKGEKGRNLEEQYSTTTELSGADPVPQPTKIRENSQPLRVIVFLGSSAQLKCDAYGYPEPAVLWWKDTQLVPLYTEKYEYLGYTLKIKDINLHDLGVYTCQAYNGIGNASSFSTTLLTVGPVHSENLEDRSYMKYVINWVTPSTTAMPIDEHPNFTVPVEANITLEETIFPVGSDISIPCDTEGYPVPEVQWYKNGVPLNLSYTFQVNESHTLYINNVTMNDNGEYKCSAWNDYSNATSTIILLAEEYPKCADNVFFANCSLILKAGFCLHKYYARFCCRTCTDAGILLYDYRIRLKTM